MSLLILECTPKQDKVREGFILKEFLHMTEFSDVFYKEFVNKNNFLNYIGNEDRMDNYDVIHISGHGIVDDDEAYFSLPRGGVKPDEFPKRCFSDKLVALSACELGKIAFIRPFMENTDAKYVIAPQREIDFIDAALFFINFYYFIYHHNMKYKTAYDRIYKFLGDRIRGAFRYWSR